MRTIHRTRLPLTIAALALVAAVAAGRTAASAGQTAVTQPVIKVSLTGSRMTVDGAKTWRPGAVHINAVTRAPDQEVTLLRFRPGYSYARFIADGTRAHGRNAAAHAALRHLLAGTMYLGGVDIFPGQPAGFTITVHPGTYYLAQLNRRPNLIAIHVSGPAGAGAPSSGGLVTASDTGYRLDRQAFPAHGTITVRNTGTQQHRLSFVPIKRGTTRAQLAAYLRKTGASDNAPPPPFARKGPQLGTAAISPAQQMQLNYSLPPGEYALIDFGQDPSNGKPDSLEGLCTVATLR